MTLGDNHVEYDRGDDKCIKNCGRKPEGKRRLGRTWQNNVRLDLKKYVRRLWTGLI